jgi:tetratricopeptide (TPR) repeat protein
MEAALGSLSFFWMNTWKRVCGTAATIAMLCAMSNSAQAQARTTLEYSESMFTLMAALNACGYDQDLPESLALRSTIREEVNRATQGRDAQDALLRTCKFYGDHNPGDASRNLAQYVSLGLNLGEPPSFALKVKEADLAPDATYVLGIVPLLQNFYITTELHKIYAKHHADYERAVEDLHDPVNDLLVNTDLYLRRPLSSYLGRSFVVLIEPMISPGQTNSRNYSDDYYVVLSPDNGSKIKIDQVRHTYLHYILDPLMLKKANALQKLTPLLNAVATAPMDESYKTDMSLLATESLIQAIEARQIGGRKGPEKPRLDAVEHAMREGFVLTQYYYECLLRFEKSDTGFQQGFADWLHDVDPQHEMKRIRDVQFLPAAEQEVVSRNRRSMSMTELAERALASGNSAAAAKFAKQALDRHDDEGHANFVLARAATLEGKMAEANSYFEKTLVTSKDPRELAWAHIYLGRIHDLRGEREDAVAQYQAALTTGDASAETHTAAQAGIQQPYQPNRK